MILPGLLLATSLAAPIPIAPQASLDGGLLTLVGTPGVAPLRIAMEDWGRGPALQPWEPAAPLARGCMPGVAGCAPAWVQSTGALRLGWRGRGASVAWGWTVAASPPGTGPLELRLRVEGLRASQSQGPDRLVLEGANRQYTVSALRAWDADGVTLPAAMRVVHGRIVVTVDDAGARYPLTVDPVITEASTTLHADSLGREFGKSVAGAGDINGDGYDDLLIGDPSWGDDVTMGQVGVWYGGPMGMDAAAASTLTSSTSTEFGFALGPAGDVNGDGYADVLINGADARAGTEGRWVVHVHLGGPAGLEDRPATTLMARATSDYFGISTVPLGDINDDGFDDLAVAAPYFGDENQGQVYVFLGSADGVDPIPLDLITGDAGDMAGLGLANAGDVDGDGIADLLVFFSGGPDGVLPYAGRVDLYRLGPDGLSATPTTVAMGRQDREYLGRAIAAGDINGDGLPDLLVGGPGADADAGRLLLYLGIPAGYATSPAAEVRGEATDVSFGLSLAMIGDINADGFDDFAAGGTPEIAWVYEGGPAAPTRIASLDHSHDAPDKGLAIAGAGDLNGNGADDLVLGSGNAPDGGAAWVHLGYGDADGDGVWVGGAADTPQDCDDTNPDIGAIYVDADGDGVGGEITTQDCGDSATSATTGDCDDSDPTIHPGAADPSGDGIDQDCDGTDGATVSGSPAAGETGCACATTGAGRASALALPALLGLIAIHRRRRSPARSKDDGRFHPPVGPTAT